MANKIFARFPLGQDRSVLILVEWFCGNDAPDMNADEVDYLIAHLELAKQVLPKEETK